MDKFKEDNIYVLLFAITFLLIAIMSLLTTFIFFVYKP